MLIIKLYKSYLIINKMLFLIIVTNSIIIYENTVKTNLVVLSLAMQYNESKKNV